MLVFYAFVCEMKGHEACGELRENRLAESKLFANDSDLTEIWPNGDELNNDILNGLGIEYFNGKPVYKGGEGKLNSNSYFSFLKNLLSHSRGHIILM